MTDTELRKERGREVIGKMVTVNGRPGEPKQYRVIEFINDGYVVCTGSKRGDFAIDPRALTIVAGAT